MMGNSGVADLHLHTTFSDGYHSPRALIDKVAGLGIAAISITDHDEVAALPIAMTYGKQKNVEVLTGIELSVHFNGQDIHLLGYCFDHENSELARHLELFKNERVKRAERIVQKLANLGISISFDDILAKAGNGVIGRPHIANVLLEKGHVFSFQEAFDKYLGTDKPANVDKYKIELSTALALIRDAGGICSIAHPAIQLRDADVLQLIEHGVEGIEVVHPKHGEVEIALFTDLAENHNLVMTGGSDFHGGSKGEETLGKYIVSNDVVNQLKAMTGST